MGATAYCTEHGRQRVYYPSCGINTICLSASFVCWCNWCRSSAASIRTLFFVRSMRWLHEYGSFTRTSITPSNNALGQPVTHSSPRFVPGAKPNSVIHPKFHNSWRVECSPHTEWPHTQVHEFGMKKMDQRRNGPKRGSGRVLPPQNRFFRVIQGVAC